MYLLHLGSFCEPGSLHENTFKGCKTKFKPQALYHARKQHNKDSTKRQEKRRMHGVIDININVKIKYLNTILTNI